MKCATLLIAVIALFGADAFTPQSQKTKPVVELKKAAASTFAALAIGSSILGSPFIADAVEPFAFSSTNVVAEKVVRQGMYQDYEVDVVQSVDDASSTFKSAKETKTKKGKYTAILAILVVGSFIVPMAQYFWYVRDDDSSEKFFAEDIPEPPKKKGWF
mmetsp:Transcript_15874/g.38940  ORF Transcript_15874/g.38940 Transcript_15874/m.38940 type:complete len:159 (+) Transcript_15874:17-493(+)